MKYLLKILVVFSALVLTSCTIIGQNRIDSLSLRSYDNLRFEILNAYDYQIKKDFNNSHYKYKAFFCRLEDKLYIKTGKNIRFRLGSLDYVNKLESK